ncbi:hypothetical protein GW17_00061808 [Ensete ventricosum]|nr:hypothetical protein GW17_00061808 [Ensete ventricosum]
MRQGWPWADRWRSPPCRHAAGSHSLRPGHWRPPLAGTPRAAALAAWSRAVAPCGLAAASCARGRPPLLGCYPCGWPPLSGGLAVADRPIVGEPWLQEIVYPCIPDLDGEDEGGQASSSLAVSRRWISIAKLLQSDLVTLAKREEG